MTDFENHCWKDIIPSDVLEIYSHYERKVFVGPSPALLAIDLYELAYQGGAKPVADLHKTYPSSLGEYAYGAALSLILGVIGVVAALALWRLMDMKQLLQQPRIEVH